MHNSELYTLIIYGNYFSKNKQNKLFYYLDGFRSASDLSSVNPVNDKNSWLHSQIYMNYLCISESHSHILLQMSAVSWRFFQSSDYSFDPDIIKDSANEMIILKL